MILRYTPHARGQLENIAEYIAKKDPAASARVGAQIHRTAWLLTEFPLLGHESGLNGAREIVVPRFPYVVLYRIEKNKEVVEIIGVYHTAQENL